MKDTVVNKCSDVFDLTKLNRDENNRMIGYTLQCECGDPNETFNLKLNNGVDVNWELGDKFKVDVIARPFTCG